MTLPCRQTSAMRRQVERLAGELGVVHQLEPLGIRLHDGVFDPVMDHLDVVPRAGRPHVGVAVLGGEVAEDRLQAVERRASGRRSSGSSRAPGPRCRRRCRRRCSRSPWPRARPDRRMSSVYFELPPSMMQSPFSMSSARAVTVDSVGPPAGTITQTASGARPGASRPARRSSPPTSPLALLRLRARGRFREVEGDHLMTFSRQSRGHVQAHLAEADHAELHGTILEEGWSGVRSVGFRRRPVKRSPPTVVGQFEFYGNFRSLVPIPGHSS